GVGANKNVLYTFEMLLPQYQKMGTMLHLVQSAYLDGQKTLECTSNLFLHYTKTGLNHFDSLKPSVAAPLLLQYDGFDLSVLEHAQNLTVHFLFAFSLVIPVSFLYIPHAKKM